MHLNLHPQRTCHPSILPSPSEMQVRPADILRPSSALSSMNHSSSRLSCWQSIIEAIKRCFARLLCCKKSAQAEPQTTSVAAVQAAPVSPSAEKVRSREIVTRALDVHLRQEHLSNFNPAQIKAAVIFSLNGATHAVRTGEVQGERLAGFYRQVAQEWQQLETDLDNPFFGPKMRWKIQTIFLSPASDQQVRMRASNTQFENGNQQGPLHRSTESEMTVEAARERLGTLIQNPSTQQQVANFFFN